MEKVRYSYNQNDTIKDIEKLMKHVEKLGYHIVNWYTMNGMLHMDLDKKDDT